MSALLQIALTNAVLALGLAVIAWASSFLRRLSRSRLRTIAVAPPRLRAAPSLASGGEA